MRWTHMSGNGSSHVLKVCLLEKMRQRWLQPLMKSYWEEKAYEDIEDSSGWNGFILLILTIGMSYYQGWCNTNCRKVSSAQTNRIPSANMRETHRTTLALVDLWTCFWLGWIALETGFLESLGSLKIMAFSVRWRVLFFRATEVPQKYEAMPHFYTEVPHSGQP
jgi:hypothetical protein